jgi:hypothetical protein
MSIPGVRPTFTITVDHLKLLAHANVQWENSEYGAPAIDCKKPYGNSNVEDDIGEILGWQAGDNDGERCWSRAQHERAAELHRQTETVLQIVLATQSFRVGTYRQRDRYKSRGWEFVGEQPA